MAAYGAVTLYHIENVTPEADEQDVDDVEDKVVVSEQDIKTSYKEMGEDVEDVDLIAIGCPHASISEIMEVAKLLYNRRLKVPMWIFTSKPTKDLAIRAGLVEKLEKANVKLLADTCPVVSPIEDLGIRKVATNSGKASFYLPNARKQIVLFNDIKEIVEKFAS